MYGMDALNTSNIFVNSVLDTTIVIDNPERHPLNNYVVNLNFLRRFKSNQQLSVNADYIYFNDANTLDYFNNFYNKTGTFLYSDKTKSKKETPINFQVATADYSTKLAHNIDMEAGVKGTLSHFVNDVKVERQIQNSWIIDSGFTSKSNLDESIFAGYTSFNIKLGPKTTSKIGLRYEYTNSNLGTQSIKNIVDRHYGNWFPNLFLSHKVSDENSINFSYNRRITRPTFNDMAPFVYFVDPNTIFSGNPALQPSTSNQVKFDYLVNHFVFSLSYTYEKNTITNFSPHVDPLTNKQTVFAENQKNKKIVALNISLPFTVTTWWTMQNNLSGYWQQLNAMYKAAPLQITQGNFNINSTQTVTLPKSYSFELSGDYQSGGMFGIYKLGANTSLNIGVQKKLAANGGILVLNVTNFSGPPRFRASVNAPEHNLITKLHIRDVVTTFKLTYTRKFGNAKIKEQRSRNTGSEDERKRVQTN
jgi:outer membrane receptor protein involved in Fe transport